jgi:hypothetical protein
MVKLNIEKKEHLFAGWLSPLHDLSILQIMERGIEGVRI